MHQHWVVILLEWVPNHSAVHSLIKTIKTSTLVRSLPSARLWPCRWFWRPTGGAHNGCWNKRPFLFRSLLCTLSYCTSPGPQTPSASWCLAASPQGLPVCTLADNSATSESNPRRWYLILKPNAELDAEPWRRGPQGAGSRIQIGVLSDVHVCWFWLDTGNLTWGISFAARYTVV